jgi:protein-S-isoprenylcysteine O-methyltransferase Ste14
MKMTWLLPPYLVLFCLLAMIGMDQLLPVTDVIQHPWKWTGVVVFAIGLTLNVPSARLFRRLKTNIIPFRDPGSVVETGFFAYTRNPMYLGFVLNLLGVAILLGSPMPFLMVVAFLAAADRWYIPDEERRLKALFGAEYAAYCARVRRWI